MKKLFILLMSILISLSGITQSITAGTIVSGGDYFIKPGSKLSGSTGELGTGLKKNGNAVLTQGFDQASYTYWKGKNSSDWQDTLNWNGPFPGLHTDIIILSPVQNNLIVNSNANCRRLYLRPGAAVTVNSGISLLIHKQ